LPTFVERQALDQLYAKPPVDRFVNGTSTSTENGSEDAEKAAVEVPAFIQPKKGLSNSGFSINHPSATWNRESDQLADELAALAMEFDPDLKSEAPSSKPPTAFEPVPEPASQSPRPARVEDEYVYETYIRMSDEDLAQNVEMVDPSTDTIGVLVIDEEDEDLWEGYMESDDDSEHDDEDSNGTCSTESCNAHADRCAAEDNPANDYPDEELSSDDEFSRNPYRYHRDHEYDDEDDDDYA
jgi:hypothetical protein